MIATKEQWETYWDKRFVEDYKHFFPWLPKDANIANIQDLHKYLSDAKS